MDGGYKLGDIKAVNTEWGGSFIMFLNENGGTKKYTLSKEEQEVLDTNATTIQMMFQYASDDECKEWDDGTTPGWYFTADESALLNMNELAVDDGKGFLFKPAEAGAQVVTAGEVAAEDTELVGMSMGEYNLTGNITPVSIKLGDITTSKTEWGGSFIMFLNENGGTKKYTLSKEEQETLETSATSFQMMFQYASPAECAEWDDGTTPGWYFTADESAMLNMNELPIAAGEGFLFKPAESGATLIIPSAL